MDVDMAELLAEAPDPLRLSEHFEEDGEVMLHHACRLSLEGLVSKRRDGGYPAGRTGAWIKSKCSARQEFVIAGYVPSTVARDLVGSLVLGTYQDGALVHVGRVGTGFSRTTARDLAERLKALERKGSPFAEKLPADAARGVTWVKPELVAEIEYRSRTGSDVIRHATFRDLSDDRSPADVVRPKSDGPKVKAVAAPQVKLTNPSRLLWPEQGITKQGLADFSAWTWFALFLPPDVPAPISAKLHEAAAGAIGMPFMQARLKQIGAEVVAPERRSQAYLRKFVETEIAKWASDLKGAYLKPY